jgi:hypothetical protein
VRLRVTFQKYGVAPDRMPSAAAVTDDYMEDEHDGLPEYYVMQVVELKADSDPTDEYREAFVHIPDRAVLALFEQADIYANVVRVEEADHG